MDRRISFAIGFFLSLTLADGRVHASVADEVPLPALDAPDDAPDQILKLSRDRSRRMTVDVVVGGKGPFPFIVDSGAEKTAITRELATSLDLAVARVVQVHSLGGSEVAQTVIVPELAINEITARKVETPVLLEENIGASGIIGIDLLQTRRVVIDFKAGTMTIANAGRDDDGWEGESIVITARRLLGELVLADASIGDVPIYVIVDTGAQVSVGNDALRRLLFRARNTPNAERFDVRGATGDLTEVSATVADGVRIGGLQIHNLPIAFAEARLFHKLRLDREPALLLGMDALRLFDRVSIDFARRKVRFSMLR